ncbi:hypothetical protein E2C01_034275 [Portunus trituberculatus]|uniref:Uncharacterized protein n=1 Tax=Portunus trituberculatus TaxID=210409 RepID=A0A5B7F042_PORTR|nr:hypothetical protein [Portunus trituberculatus]
MYATSQVYIAHIHSDGRVNVDSDTERVHLFSEVWWGPGKGGWDVISDQSEEPPTATLLSLVVGRGGQAAQRAQGSADKDGWGKTAGPGESPRLFADLSGGCGCPSPPLPAVSSVAESPRAVSVSLW